MRDTHTNKSISEKLPDDLKAIIFDFDGTIVDSEPLWKSVFIDLFRDNYGAELTQKVVWENTGKGVVISVTNISDVYSLNLSETEIDSVSKEINDQACRRIISELEPRPGAVELFNWCDNKNIKMAICTASTHEMIHEYCSKHNLIDNFEYVFSTAISDIEKRKPHPFPYLHSMERLGVTPNASLAIEDSPAGVKSAVTAGIATIAIHNPMIEQEVELENPLVQVEDFFQVLDLLAG